MVAAAVVTGVVVTLLPLYGDAEGGLTVFIEKIRYYMVVLLKHFTKHSDNATGTNKTLQIEICLRLKLTILLPTGKQNALLIKKHS